MKKRTITLIVLLAILVILAALVCVGLVKSAEAHDAVYADYDAAVSAVEGAALAVIENGSTVGTYSLADLGVRDATLAAASAPYSAVDRMDADAFAREDRGTALSDDDIAGNDIRAVSLLDAEALRFAVTAVLRRTNALFMSKEL